jgi:hypothetical protein
MSYCGVSIFSDNLSGQTSNVTFYPCSGGTIELGEQTFPFSYITDYWYGTYDCYVPTYAYSYVVDVPCPSPTPTPTSTVTPTVTMTPSPVYYYYYLLNCDLAINSVGRSSTLLTGGTFNVDTNTCYTIVGNDPGPLFGYNLDVAILVTDCTDALCNLPTPTPTPTQTNTQTTTVTPTNTETPTVTPTQTPTNTETPTVTPTITPNQTQTPTPTQTPSITPSGVILYVFSCLSGGTSPYDACNGSDGAFLYGVEPIFVDNNYFFNTPIGGIDGDIAGYYNYLETLVELDALGNTLGITLCSVLPTNTPTPTTTSTPTQTPTNTETQTPTPTNTETTTSTPTPTNTETSTPTQTPTNTETPTQTQTQTPTNTQTPTPTQTQTPSGPLCKRYSFNGGTTDTLFAGKDCSGFDYSFTVNAGNIYVGCVTNYIIVEGNGFATYISPC